MAFEYYRSVIGFSCGGNYAAVVQHWEIDTPGGGGPFSRAKALVEAMETPTSGDPYLTAIANILSEDSFISSVRAAKINPGVGNQFAKVFEPSVLPGTFSGDLDASSVAGCVIWMTGGSFGLHGKTFWPGVSEEALSGGRFTTSYKSALVDLMNVIIAGIVSSIGTFDPTLKHGSPAAFNTIVHGRLSLTPGTIRKRLKPV